MTRAQELIEGLFGVPDAAARGSVDVIRAQAVAFERVRTALGVYRAPRACRRTPAADRRSATAGGDDRDPTRVLERAAIEALEEYLVSGRLPR